MTSYFARRLVGGVVTLFLASLLLYSLLIYAPGGANDQLREVSQMGQSRTEHHINPNRIFMAAREFRLDKPCPLSYASWLLGQGGKGVLTGVFGVSIQVARDHPVTDVLGLDLGPFMLLMLVPLLAAMTLVLVQSWRRPHIDGLPHSPHVSVLLDEHRQRLAFPQLLR